jgi:hypothetical protein
VASASVKVLFSEATYAMFKEMEVRVGPRLGSTSGTTVAPLEFIDARDRAIKAMYDEVIGIS